MSGGQILEVLKEDQKLDKKDRVLSHLDNFETVITKIDNVTVDKGVITINLKEKGGEVVVPIKVLGIKIGSATLKDGATIDVTKFDKQWKKIDGFEVAEKDWGDDRTSAYQPNGTIELSGVSFSTPLKSGTIDKINVESKVKIMELLEMIGN